MFQQRSQTLKEPSFHKVTRERGNHESAVRLRVGGGSQVDLDHSERDGQILRRDHREGVNGVREEVRKMKEDELVGW